MNELARCGMAFVYFNDYEGSCRALARMGFFLHADYGFARVYRAAAGFFVGAVAADKPQPDAKGVMLCLTYSSEEEVRAARQRLECAGFSPSPAKTSERLSYYCFTVDGPEGYRFEIGHFTDPREGALLNPPVGTQWE